MPPQCIATLTTGLCYILLAYSFGQICAVPDIGAILLQIVERDINGEFRTWSDWGSFGHTDTRGRFDARFRFYLEFFFIRCF